MRNRSRIYRLLVPSRANMVGRRQPRCRPRSISDWTLKVGLGVFLGGARSIAHFATGEIFMSFDSKRRGRRFALSALFVVAFASTAVFAAAPVPQNIGGGLEVLLESHNANTAKPFRDQLDGQWTTQAAANYADLAIRDNETGRFVVNILPARKDVDTLRAELEASIPSLDITEVDKTYRGTGIL